MRSAIVAGLVALLAATGSAAQSTPANNAFDWPVRPSTSDPKLVARHVLDVEALVEAFDARCEPYRDTAAQAGLDAATRWSVDHLFLTRTAKRVFGDRASEA